VLTATDQNHHTITSHVNVMLSSITFFIIFAVFDQSPLTLWMNLFLYICCFITNFSIFRSTFSGNLEGQNGSCPPS